MSIRIVQSAQNARLKELRRALSNPPRNGEGWAGIEGPNLLTEAVRAGLHIRCVFVAQGSERMVEVLRLAEPVETLAFPRELLNAALATETPQPLAALVEPPTWTWADLLAEGPAGDRQQASLIVVLAGLQDPGNLGTIVRSAEAFGANGVICLPGTVSAWNPKAVRASAGSIFRVPVLIANEDEAMTKLREAGVRILATTVQGTPHAGRFDLTGSISLVIGNEGNGVPAELAAKADEAVTIPCPGPVESLNAAVAASVLLYEASRQRAKNGMQKMRRGAR